MDESLQLTSIGHNCSKPIVLEFYLDRSSRVLSRWPKEVQHPEVERADINLQYIVLMVNLNAGMCRKHQFSKLMFRTPVVVALMTMRIHRIQFDDHAKLTWKEATHAR
jgi:hypothetical protein